MNSLSVTQQTSLATEIARALGTLNTTYEEAPAEIKSSWWFDTLSVLHTLAAACVSGSETDVTTAYDNVIINLLGY